MQIFQVDAFTTHPYTGNPATVVLGASGSSEQELATIAREFPHAETAFVFPPSADDHDIHVRFFNARKEAAFVGHATLAVHHILFALGLRSYGIHRQKSKQGIIHVAAADGTKAQRNGQSRVVSEEVAPGGATARTATLFEFRQTAAELVPIASEDL